MGKPASGQPEAELWVGAHPKAPSRLEDGSSLLELIDSGPEQWLGSRSVEAFGPRLPYLLKILAVDAPLSLQAHPNREQARLGFLREQRSGVPLDARERTFKDDNHKPELLCALSPFEALCGFRAQAQSAELFEQLALEDRSWALQLREEGGLRRVFQRLLALPKEAQLPTVAAVVAACDRRGREDAGRLAPSLAWALRLAEAYPGDLGVVASLLLNHVALRPGQAIFLGAGQLHAYLSGVGVELMANSDNVLRGGLTAKHVDVHQLQQVVEFAGSAAHRVEPLPQHGLVRYPTPAAEFELSRAELLGEPLTVSGRGPRLCLCTQGTIELEVRPAPAQDRQPGSRARLALNSGRACFVPAGVDKLAVAGRGQVFFASLSPGATSA